MQTASKNGWIGLSTAIFGQSCVRDRIHKHANELAELLGSGNPELDSELSSHLGQRMSDLDSTAAKAFCSILTDLALQRWSIRVISDCAIEVKRPENEEIDQLREKERVRAQELVKRDEQLREPATRRFIESMERRTLYRGRFVSIFSLMREGRDLSEALRSARTVVGPHRDNVLRATIDPYLQFVGHTAVCEQTGLKLQDIWRYFRHTWSNQYTSTPGRSMNFLVRDRAEKFHPVIGIGSIGSPIVQIRERDTWIGWHPETFLEQISDAPLREVGKWLDETVRSAIGEIFIDDFLEEGLVTISEIQMPTQEVVSKLIQYGQRQRKLHHRLAGTKEFRNRVRDVDELEGKERWKERAKSHLFRSKRALALADMLRCRIGLQKYLSSEIRDNEIQELLGSRDGRQVVKRVLLKAKSGRVGISMADITVCGAVPPYNALLGGKLVSMLAVSPEVVAAYRLRYLEHESEIASAMAGRPIVRSSELVFLSTTSLYGVGSSQYNRLRMPAGVLGGHPREQFSFVEIGKSEAFGSSHFSEGTLELLVSLVQQTTNGQRVNSIFGEGVSPKFRKIRSGLDALRLPSDALLRHGRQRIIYGIPLVRNLREFLLGMEEKADYIFEEGMSEKGTEAIVGWWMERWLMGRIQSNKVLADVESHTLVRPVRHGARVKLPPLTDSQGALFDDLG